MTLASADGRPRAGSRDRRRSTLIAVTAASLAAHALVLGGLALTRGAEFVLPAAPPPVILVEMEPRPLLPGESVRRPRPAAPAVQETVTASGAYAAARAPVAGAAPTPEQTAPLPQAAAPSPSRTIDPLWQVRPETEADRIARATRAAGVGCHPPSRQLTPAEQASCDRRLAEAARSAPAARGTGDRERDARFAAQGARELAQYEARRAPLAGGTGVLGVADCPGGNLGQGCAGAHLPSVQGVDMHQGGETVIRQPSNKLD